MTAPTPHDHAERVEGEANQGIGWYEFITPKATTRIAYVGESGRLYLPEGDPEEHFYLASARGRAHRLIRADALDVEEIARVLDDHQRVVGPHGLTRTCTCGVDLGPVGNLKTHQARALRAAILGNAW